MSIYQSPREDWPDPSDLLTDDGHELPRTILPPHLQAVVDRAMRRADRMANPMRCVCGHTIADHTPVADSWLVGARTVTETREQCDKCDCDDFEEIPTMTDITIPDAAVEAAARNMFYLRATEPDQSVPCRDTDWDSLPDSWQEEWRDGARAALAAQALKDMGEWFDRAAQLGTGERDVIAAQACYDRADLIEAGNG